MYKRRAIQAKLVPQWVQQQFAKEAATIHKSTAVGNSLWVLLYTMDVLPGSPPPPDSLLFDPMYLQMMQ